MSSGNAQTQPNPNDVTLLCTPPEWWLRWPYAERCLLLLGYVKENGGVVISDWIPIANTHPKYKDRSDVVGVLHSHPGTLSARPSATDLLGLPDGLLGGVWSHGSVRWFVTRHK